MSYQRDRIMWPIQITTTNNQFSFNENTSELTFTIPVGTYYLHDDTSLDSSYKGLYTTIESAMNDAGANTYVLTSSIPLSSSLQTGCGLLFVRDGGSLNWGINWQNTSNFTMNPRWFGFDRLSNDNEISSDEINSPYTRYGDWCSANIIDNAATDKRSRTVKEIRKSHNRPSDLYQITWNVDKIRTMSYQWVPAAHVFPDRANDAGYAETAKLATNDTNNQFYDVWNSGSLNQVLLIQYGNVAGLSDVDSGDWEAVQFYNDDASEDFFNVASLNNEGGELYDLELELYVVEGNYEH